jgi:hypothetical protein
MMTCVSDRSGSASSGVRLDRPQSPSHHDRGQDQHNEAIGDRPSNEVRDHGFAPPEGLRSTRELIAIALLHEVELTSSPAFSPGGSPRTGFLNPMVIEGHSQRETAWLFFGPFFDDEFSAFLNP